MNTLLMIFGLAGLTVIITSGAIFEGVREILSSKSKSVEKLINCPMCTGFWVGLIYGFYIEISPVILAGVIAILAWSIYTIVDYFSTKATWYAVRTMRDSKTEEVEDVEENNESKQAE